MSTPFHFTLLFLIAGLLSACQPEVPPTTAENADLVTPKWQNVNIQFTGPQSSEDAAENPFRDYRLDVNFFLNDSVFTVPGYYAADGDAANSSAEGGNVWAVNFRPAHEGAWRWEAVMRKGEDIVYNDQQTSGERIEVGNQTGTLFVGPPAAGERGRLVRTHPRYLQWAETGKYFLKGGADSPENLLGYADFDGTYRHSNTFRDGENKTEGLHHFTSHEADFTSGSPTWGDGKGKGILGAISYLAARGINSIYFLTLNINGDGKDVWPFVDHKTFDRYDVSKLAQWERVFQHADDLGMNLHFVLQETENETLLDNGDTGPMRKLYFRELIARFGHHRAVTWNLGEENGPNDWSKTHQNNAQQKAEIAWLANNDPYQGYIVLHTHPHEAAFAEIYEPLLGNKQLNGLSIQIGNPYSAYEVTKKWIQRSEAAQSPWIMSLDEVGPWWRGLDPDAGFSPNPALNNQDSLRALTLWGNLMAGGAGVEWYFGAYNENNDLNTEDWRSRDRAWGWTSRTIDFFTEHVPFHEMSPMEELVSAPVRCLAKSGETYLVHLPYGGTASLDLSAVSGNFSVHWFDPAAADGSRLMEQEPQAAGGQLKLTAPGKGDWACLLRKI